MSYASAHTLAPNAELVLAVPAGVELAVSHTQNIEIFDKVNGQWVGVYGLGNTSATSIQSTSGEIKARNNSTIAMQLGIAEVVAGASPLAAGAATEAKQGEGNDLLASIENLLGTVAQDATVQDVITALNGVATSAKQDEAKAVLLDILTSLGDNEALLTDVIAALNTGNANTAQIASDVALIKDKVSTEAKQDAGNTLLTAIQNVLGTTVAKDATVAQVVTALNDVATGTKQTEQKTVLLDILSKATNSDAKLADVVSWLSALNDEMQTNTSNTAAISGNTADIMNHIQSLDAKANDFAKDATLKSESDESQLKQDESNILLTSLEDLINQLKNNAEAQYALLNAEHTPTEYNVVNSTDTFPKNPQCRQLSILAIGDGCKSNGFLKKDGFGHTFASSGTLPIDSIELTADAASEWIIFEYNTAI